MSIPLEKTIRPTKLQPQLFSVVKHLSQNNDYKVVVDKDNQPLCALISFDMLKKSNVLSQEQQNSSLGDEIESYYKQLSDDENDLLNGPIDDIID